MKLDPSQYVVDYAANTFTFDVQAPGTGWLSLTTMQLGAVKLLDSMYASTSTGNTVELTSFVSYSDVNSSYVTLNGISVASSATNYPGMYTLTSYNGAARITVNALGTVQAYLFKGDTKSFSEITESVSTASATLIPLSSFVPPVTIGNAGPFHSQVIVTQNGRRLRPPVTTYYQVASGQTTFDISKSTVYPLGLPDVNHIEVYVNGTRTLPARKWKLDQANNQIKFRSKVLQDGDVIAIVVKEDNEYLIDNGNLVLSSASTVTTQITSFTNHDPDFIRSEVFRANANNQYYMQRSVIDPAYVWVSYNGLPLTVNLDYTIGTDGRTVNLRNGIYQSQSDTVIVTSFADVEPTIGYRIFRDMLGRTHFKRLAQSGSTTLSQNLNFSDEVISVEDASKLTPPDPASNRPGVILIDGERIEFFVIVNNQLRQLRRSTLGTGSKGVYYAGTSVVDQGIAQTIPFRESKDTTSTYTVSTNIIGYNSSTVITTTVGTVTTTVTNVTFTVTTGTEVKFTTGTSVSIQNILSGNYNITGPISSIGNGTITVTYQNTFTSIPAIGENAILIGAGISLSNFVFVTNDQYNRPIPAAVDQVEVRYQGISLLKPTVTTSKHDPDIAYDSSSTLYSTSTAYGDVIVPYGFTINTSTKQITLNTATVTLVEGAKLEVIRRTSTSWYSTTTTSLARSTTVPAKFLSGVPAALPRFLTSSTYAAVDLDLILETTDLLTDENGNPLEGI